MTTTTNPTTAEPTHCGQPDGEDCLCERLDALNETLDGWAIERAARADRRARSAAE